MRSAGTLIFQRNNCVIADTIWENAHSLQTVFFQRIRNDKHDYDVSLMELLRFRRDYRVNAFVKRPQNRRSAGK